MEAWASCSMALSPRSSFFAVRAVPGQNVRKKPNREKLPIIARARGNRCFTVLWGIDSACIGITRYAIIPKSCLLFLNRTHTLRRVVVASFEFLGEYREIAK